MSEILIIYPGKKQFDPELQQNLINLNYTPDLIEETSFTMPQKLYSHILADAELGNEILNRIKSLSELNQIPLILFFTGPLENINPAETYENYNGLLFYPFNENQLKIILNNAQLSLTKNKYYQYGRDTLSKDFIDYEILFNKDQIIVSFNNPLMELLQLKDGNPAGKKTDDVFYIQDINHSKITDFSEYLSIKNNLYHPGYFLHNDFRIQIYFSIFENETGYTLRFRDILKNENLLKELVDIKYTLDQHSIIAITDKKGRIKYANKKFLEISGYSLDELIGKPQNVINSGYHPKSFFKNLWDTINAGKIWKGEIRNQAKDGSFYWVNTTIVPFMDENNQPYQFIAIRTDITKKKSMEFTQRENEFRYRTIAEMTSDFIYCMEVTDTGNFKMIWLTETFSHMTGYTTKELEDNGIWKWEKIVHPEDMKSITYHLELILSGKTDSASFRVITKNGMIRWFQDLARPAKDETTGKITMMIGATKDITDMVQAEEAAERLLNFNESLLNSAGEGIMGLDKNGIIAFINPVATNLLGRKDIELLGENHQTAFYHTTKDGKKRIESESPIFQSLLSGKVINIHEDVFWRSDNKPISVEYVSSPIMNDKTVSGSVIIFKDISERLETERKIKEAREIAEKANKSKSEFLANMSHELRTPLNSIIGFSKLMKFSKSEDEQQEFADYIHSSGTHLLRLINDLLDYSKIEAGKMQFDRNPVNIKRITEESITLISLQASQKDIDVIFTNNNCDNNSVTGDEKRLKQVIINLLSNAVKFTEKDGKVEVTINCKSDMIEISVKDSGIGMNPEDIEIIFENFTQLSSGFARNSEGTGLGLAISKKIMEYHDGYITVDSSPGKGSTFTIFLPVIPHQGLEEHFVPALKPEYPNSLKNKMILVVEDDPSSKSLLEAFFSINNQKAIFTVNGKEGFEIYNSKDVDIILTDLRMPEMDGYELLKAVKEKNKQIPVIAISANQFNMEYEDSLKFLRAEGFDNYVAKPIDFDLLVSILDNLSKN